MEKSAKKVTENAVATERDKNYRLPYHDECESMPIFS
jgi:hypothetical protein